METDVIQLCVRIGPSGPPLLYYHAEFTGYRSNVFSVAIADAKNFGL